MRGAGGGGETAAVEQREEATDGKKETSGWLLWVGLAAVGGAAGMLCAAAVVLWRSTRGARLPHDNTPRDKAGGPLQVRPLTPLLHFKDPFETRMEL
jgi:hypothetical protein